jgi:predicted RND superfamily exporter protein
MPIIFERSLQAQIVIPMAISLAFGILFATVITLLLVPSLYIVLDDFKGIIRGKKSKQQGQASQSIVSSSSGDIQDTIAK